MREAEVAMSTENGWFDQQKPTKSYGMRAVRISIDFACFSNIGLTLTDALPRVYAKDLHNLGGNYESIQK